MGAMGLEDLGNRLQKMMDQRGMTPYSLAVAAGLHPTALYKIVSGERHPSLETASKVAHALGMTTSELIGESRPIDPPVDEMARLAAQLTGFRWRWARQVLELAPRLSERQQQMMLDMMREIVGNPAQAAEQVTDDKEVDELDLRIAVEDRANHQLRTLQPVDEAQEAPKRAAS